MMPINCYSVSRKRRLTAWLELLAAVFTLLIILPILSSNVYAQGGSVIRQVVSPDVPSGSGQPAANVPVRVCTSAATGTPCSPLVANIYQDQALTEPIGNPFSTDQNGNYQFFIGTGSYIVQENPVPNLWYSWLIFVNGTGTVSSVALSMPTSLFSVTGSPITSTGTFGVSLINQPSYDVFANCTSGSAVPAFCALVANQIPSTLNSTTFPSVTVTGAETIGTTLGVTGLSTLSGGAAISGGGSIAGTFTGSPIFSGNPSFTGTTSLAATTLTDTLTSSGGGLAGAFAGTPTFSGSTVNFSNAVSVGTTLTATTLEAASAIIQGGILVPQTPCASGTLTTVNPSGSGVTVIGTPCSFASGNLNTEGKTFTFNQTVHIAPAVSSTYTFYLGIGNGTLGTPQPLWTAAATTDDAWFQVSATCGTRLVGSAGIMGCTVITQGNSSTGASLTQSVPVPYFFTGVPMTAAVYVGTACAFGTGNIGNACTSEQVSAEQIN